MKALSIKQPWLWAITDLNKRVENRTWKPAYKIVGQRIAFHASKQDDPHGENAIYYLAGPGLPPEDIPRGAIVATARLCGWFDGDGYRFIWGKFIPTFEQGDFVHNKWFFGPIGWVFDDIQKLSEPIPCRGARGLWDVPDEFLPTLQTRPSNKALQRARSRSL